MNPLLQANDLVMMRTKAVFTAGSFEDDNIANPYYPDGATGVEAGHLAVVLSGADAGDVQPIAGVELGTGGKLTKFVLAGEWQTTPATGDLYSFHHKFSSYLSITKSWESRLQRSTV